MNHSSSTISIKVERENSWYNRLWLQRPFLGVDSPIYACRDLLSLLQDKAASLVMPEEQKRPYELWIHRFLRFIRHPN